MIGLVIITHARLGRELVSAAEFILGKVEQAATVSVDSNTAAESLHTRLEAAIAKVDSNQGVLILTDMFGGSPNNISLAFLEEGRHEVVTGVNLPMLIKAATSREGTSLDKLAHTVCEAGRDSISVASELLST
ncbi:MAG: PTS sugar transporter subunit IIA [Desulfarculaceae bacterium]|nr:PTS sugar transporter subunit IIA [Desulfarculaceae bacterium]MCF8047239.1 PTS sugar transporter subunit IIA [Desulfarculaceae bacterium]MCF8065080.1 PTS sugar transporter subunit IIA [Desulfarculaceae bacterium]MCF8098498.1 PTS sugar transporter subunit IIA [Desulfarculaceae bacterium]MCF8122327.1 PTS sugar transporter subunit IIA [Desulfarculaceae bacterium]